MVKNFRQTLLRMIAFLVVGHAFFYPVVCALLLGWDGEQLVELMLMPSHFLTVLLSLVTAYGVFTLQPWAFIAFNLYLASVAGESLVLARRLGKLEQIPVALPVILALVLFALLYGASRVRKGERWKLGLSGSLIDARSGEQLAIGTTYDLSEQGCRLRLSTEGRIVGLEKGSEVRLRLEFGALGTTEIRALVVALESADCRLKFRSIRQDQRELIQSARKRDRAKN